MLFKNVAGQKIPIYAYSTVTGLPVTGDAANITAYIALDGTPASLGAGAHPTEVDATNMEGHYYFSPSQAETNGDLIQVSPKSTTANVKLVPFSGYTTAGAVPKVVAGQASGLALVGSVMGKSPATLAPTDCGGNLPAIVKAQDNIDFGALQKASLNAATPAASNMRGTDNALPATSYVAPPSESVVATEVLSAMNATPPGVDIKKINGQTIDGDGSAADPWGKP